MSWDYVEHFATKAEYNGQKRIGIYLLSTRNNETHRDDNNNNNSLMSISWSLDEL